ncbi:predicted protein [Naegleria gruberi]|uniref:Predicted protein n=1 Tax=Naegleria gruberi TaxID=5762 RepID=D2W3B3_NAEGR|nr:uncharacterized protein NAEGRDRAFT_60003 [Naegleria gruberi]EFC36459.1 predicted protein [Naegleria gruberi]|eukprot:XP_002669203.1 predicted protein [Naegleria gruberi strain NEG-M]
MCFSINGTDSRVCSNGRGRCVGANQCECETNYFGSQCQFTTCQGIQSNDSSVCYGHGSCESFNNCTCSDGYGPSNSCQYPICFGILANNASVCNSSQICLAPDRCVPKDPICYGKFNNDSTVCSSHGTCLDNNNCKCQSGYFGNECQLWKCHNIDMNATNVCNGPNGQCSSPNNCSCTIGFLGLECETPTCQGISALNVKVCNGNGSCNGLDKCACNQGWSGSQCETPLCNGISSQDLKVCSGRGVCKCSPGYTGGNCSLPICFSLDASEFGVCYGNGKCVGPDTCKCDSLFSGMECETPTCNGKTELDGGCSFRGTCNSYSHLCECKGNFAGSSCSSCKSGFTGTSCEIPICNGISSIDKSVCNGRGSCSSVNGSSPVCVCSGNYYGANCGSFKCNGLERSNSSVCSSRGSCLSPDTCSCKGNYDPASYCSKCLPSYSGSDCTVAVCDSATTCNSKGTCNDKLQCVCSGNYAGTYCDKCKDGFVGTSCQYSCSAATTCNGKGTCSQIGECICSGNTNGKKCENCNAGWYGDKCDFNIDTTSFEFNENGDSIIATVKSSIKKKISCSSLITNTHVLGSEPSCLLDGEKSQLVIQLGPMATIVIGGSLSVRAYIDSSSVSSVTVKGTNYKSVEPSAYLTSDISSIACGNMILDSSASSSLDRRQLIFSYSATLAPSNQDITLLNSLISGSTDSFVKFPVSQLSAGTYSVQVAVQSSFSGKVSYATYTFSVTESSPPTLTIRNGASSSITIGNSLAIVPVVTFPSCYRGNPSASSLKYTYTQTSGPSLQIKQKNELLVFSSDYTQLTEEGDYVFTLKASEPGYPEASVSFKVSASALPLQVSFNIRDMSQSLEDNVKFRITKKDPSNPTSTDGQVKLTCTDLETLASCTGFDNGLNIDQSTLLFDKQFTPGSYMFTAVFSKSSRSSSTSVKVIVTSQTKATSVRIYIDTPSGSDVSAIDPSNDLILQAQSLDLLSPQRVFSWSSSDFTFDSTIDLTKKYLTIPKSLLAPGASYSVSITVTDGVKTGQASISFIVNAPPSLGIFEVSPSTGVALVDEFKVSCGNGWSDSQLPLSFKFVFRQKGEEIWKVLKEKSETRSFRTSMPTGQLEIKAIVYDAKGAFTETTSNINVTTPVDVSSAIQSLSVLTTSTLTPSSASSALSVILAVKPTTAEDKQKLVAAGLKIVQAYFAQMDAEQNVTSQTEASTSSSLSVISSVSTCVENLPDETVSLTITKFKAMIEGAYLLLKLASQDINSALDSAASIQTHVSKKVTSRSVLFTKDEVKSIDSIKDTLLSLQLKNAVPDMPATRTFGSDSFSYARLLSVSTLSSLNETINSVSSFKLSATFNSLSQVSSLDNVKLVMKVQTQAKAVSKLVTFRVESNDVDVGVSSNSNTTYIAEFNIEKNPSTRNIRETRNVCSVLQNGVLVAASGCTISSTSGGMFTIQVSSSGSYAVVSEEVVAPQASPKTSSSKTTTVITTKSNNLEYLAFLVLLVPVIAVVVIIIIVVVCCLRKKKTKYTKGQHERNFEDKSFMELNEMREI